MNLYKELWSRIGGRPWTFISRDVWHKFEYVPIVLLFVGGYYFGRFEGNLLEVFIVFTIGYIFGHFFWGRDWISGQKGRC